MGFIRLSIDRPVTTIMLFVGLALLGLISWTRLPQELFPSLEYPQITIVTRYEGAGPEEAEKLISKLIEETVGTVKNIASIKSLSKEGVSIVTCEFKWGTSMDFASMDVREKIDLVKQSLPREAQEPVVLKYNPFQIEALVLSVSYKEPTENPWKLAELRQFCKKNLKDEVERLDGIAKVEIRGGEKKEISVEVDKGRLVANQISIMELISALRNANVTYPAGVIKEQLYEYLVKTVGEFQSMSDIANLSISKEVQDDRSKRQGRKIRATADSANDKVRKITYLSDIADIKMSLKDKTGYSRYNGVDNISLAIFPQSGSNLIKISNVVNKKLASISHVIGSDKEVKIIYNQADFIKSSLNNLYSNAIQGGILSFIVLYVFLNSFAASFIICTAIPLSILMTLSLMYFGGISINTMSLGGFAIGVGMVVDNANVVLENIYTYYHANPNMNKKDIIYNATSEVVAPILSGTITTIAIFLPFIFVAGMIGQLFKDMALTITYAMVASILVALVFVPRLALNLDLSKYKQPKIVDRIFAFFSPKINAVLNWSTKKLVITITLYMVFGIIFFYFIPKEFMPKIDERRFILNVNLPPETTLNKTNDVTQKIEQYILKIKEIQDIAVTVGSTTDEGGTGVVSALGSYQARIIARLHKKGRSTNDVVADISKSIDSWKIHGLETTFVTQQGLFGSDVGSSSGLVIEIKGNLLDKLRTVATTIKDEIMQMPLVYGVKIDPPDLVSELRIDVDRERASLFGLSTQDISAMSLAAIKGYVATKLKMKDEEFDIRVRFRESDRDSIEKIAEMSAYSQWGMTIQLKQVSNLTPMKTLPQIKRIESQRTYQVMANIKSNFSKTVQEISAVINKLPKDEDVTINITGELLAMKESVGSSSFALLLGIIIIYMILASQFESIKQPLIVMVTVPLGIAGGIYTLFFTFQSINSVSMLGFIMLTGNVVNAAIILVDRYNMIHTAEPNRDIRDIVFHATLEHLRPILMTSLTTILGLFPIALGLGEGSEATSPMAITIIGGLTFCLFLTIFFIPLIYLRTTKSTAVQPSIPSAAPVQ